MFRNVVHTYVSEEFSLWQTGGKSEIFQNVGVDYVSEEFHSIPPSFQPVLHVFLWWNSPLLSFALLPPSSLPVKDY